MTKCVFGTQKLEFLGQKIKSNRIFPSDQRIEAIRDFPSPNSIRQIQRFIGMIHFYHQFIPQLAIILAPLHSHLNALQRLPKNGKNISCNNDCE